MLLTTAAKLKPTPTALFFFSLLLVCLFFFKYFSFVPKKVLEVGGGRGAGDVQFFFLKTSQIISCGKYRYNTDSSWNFINKKINKSRVDIWLFCHYQRTNKSTRQKQSVNMDWGSTYDAGNTRIRSICYSLVSARLFHQPIAICSIFFTQL